MKYAVLVTEGSKKSVVTCVGPFPTHQIAEDWVECWWATNGWQRTEVVELIEPDISDWRRKTRRRKNGHKRYSQEDDRYIKAHYERSTYKTMAAHLCRTPGAVAQRASELGITN